MLYWTFADDLATAILIFGAFNMYLSYQLTRITGGAPRAWYAIIAGFAILFIRGGTELYFDVQTPGDLIAVEQETFLLVAVVLFAIGLSMLVKAFRRQLKLAEESVA